MDFKEFENTIEFVEFPPEQYAKREEPKKQIVIHHTVSGDGIEGDIAWWLSTPDRIATHFIISRQGKIRQNFKTEYWAHHLGVKHEVFEEYGLPSAGANNWLNMKSVSIELDSWGGLLNSELGKKTSNYVEYKDGFRGYNYFEKYTDEQLESLKNLLLYLGNKHNIPLGYNQDIWDVSKWALIGESGVWSHVSFRKDKSDCHPQQELIEIIKSL